jgi:hypothetical protein
MWRVLSYLILGPGATSVVFAFPHPPQGDLSRPFHLTPPVFGSRTTAETMDPSSPAAQEALLEEFIMVLKHQRHFADYVFITALSLWIYDYLLMVYKEVSLMWPAPWSYTKVMFMVVRYLPIIALGFNVQSMQFHWTCLLQIS